MRRDGCRVKVVLVAATAVLSVVVDSAVAGIPKTVPQRFRGNTFEEYLSRKTSIFRFFDHLTPGTHYRTTCPSSLFFLFRREINHAPPTTHYVLLHTPRRHFPPLERVFRHVDLPKIRYSRTLLRNCYVSSTISMRSLMTTVSNINKRHGRVSACHLNKAAALLRSQDTYYVLDVSNVHVER